MTSEQYVIGKCQEMCPVEEQQMRRNEGLVHILEKDKAMIKCYTRSAAGVKMAKPSLIRPPEVLNSTILYLFNEVLIDRKHKFSVIYEFIEDRIKAIKQDLFIQQPSAELCFPILEPIVRFYIYCGYRLGNEERNFDTTLNHNQLLESLKWLLKEYDKLGNVSEYRIEMESLYILLNLGEPDALMRSLALNTAIRQNLIHKCERISLSWYIGNYIKVFKECLQLPILHSALLCSYQLPYIRRYALNVLNSAYSSKNLTVPLAAVSSLLLYNNNEEVELDCDTLGIRIIDNDTKVVQFNKSTWKGSDHSPKFLQNKTVNERLKNTFLPDLILSPNIQEETGWVEG